MKRLICIAAALLLTAGCATKPIVAPPPPSFTKVPQAFLVRCLHGELMESKEYAALTFDAREKYLMSVIQTQAKSIAKCNTQFQSIDVWNGEQAKAHEVK